MSFVRVATEGSFPRAGECPGPLFERLRLRRRLGFAHKARLVGLSPMCKREVRVVVLGLRSRSIRARAKASGRQSCLVSACLFPVCGWRAQSALHGAGRTGLAAWGFRLSHASRREKVYPRVRGSLVRRSPVAPETGGLFPCGRVVCGSVSACGNESARSPLAREERRGLMLNATCNGLFLRGSGERHAFCREARRVQGLFLCG